MSSAICFICITAIMFQGCVAVDVVPLEIDYGQIPPGHAVMYIAVPSSVKASDILKFELEIEEVGQCSLEKNALNRIYVPQGDRKLILRNVPQDINNKRTISTFQGGGINRFVLVERYQKSAGSEEDGVLTDANSPVYHILPVGASAFNELLRTENLQTIPLTIIHTD